MISSKALSGEQIVAKGATKLGVSLPELGVKDSVPNGSWLEQKQVQSALEARKQLIEVERIEKCGVLSHAEWREDLMLAEVTKKSGSYWQYLGHNVGKHLYLYPEEALFLMETNCLQLKLNDVTVSLQQSYSLLIRGKISLHQFRIYASLSRLGYRLLRHTTPAFNDSNSENQCQLEVTSENEKARNDNPESTDDKSEVIVDHKLDVAKTDEVQIENAIDIGERDCKVEFISKEEPNVIIEEAKIVKVEETSCDDTVNEGDNESHNTPTEMEWEITENSEESNTPQLNNNGDINETSDLSHCQIKRHSKLPKLNQRKSLNQFRSNNSQLFKEFPELLQKEIVTIDVPNNDHIPKNVIPKNKTYVLNLENITSKTTPETASNDNGIYSFTDEVNGAHIRRVRNFSFNSPHNSWSTNYFANTHTRFPRTNSHFRNFNFWPPRNNSNYVRFNLIFQRPYFPMFQNVMPRFNLFPRPPQLTRTNFYNIFNNTYSSSLSNVENRKRPKSSRRYLLNDIKKLAVKLRNLVHSGITHVDNIQALHSLVNSYNARYNTKLILTNQFEIVENENIVETIELDDEEESKSKRPRMSETTASYDENLDRIKQMSVKLKALETNEGICTRRRRAFNKAIRTFNKSYNAEMYVNSDYEILDRRHITLDSSSDSDCVIEEPVKTGKLLKNPFNILKRLSKNRFQTSPEPTTSKSNLNPPIAPIEKKYDEKIVKTFKKNWLPNVDDFGRAEVPTENYMSSRLMDCKQEEYFYEFFTNPFHKYDSWLSYKIAFWEKLEETTNRMQKESENAYMHIESVIKPEDCTDTPSILNKLSIIKPNKHANEKTNLRIHFDVYNRDVQNFRKSCPPKPHFRLICIEESTDFPSGSEVAGLHSRYQDDVGMVFGIAGVGSISYLQINPRETPIYLPNNEIQ